MLKTAIVVVASLSLLSAAIAGASPPPHDNFASSKTALRPGYSDSASNAGGTLELNEPSPSCTPVDSTVWYRLDNLTIVDPGSHVVLYVASASFRPVISLWSGDELNALSERACAQSGPAGSGGQSAVVVPLLAGAEHHIQVGSTGGSGLAGDFVLTVF